MLSVRGNGCVPKFVLQPVQGGTTSYHDGCPADKDHEIVSQVMMKGVGLTKNKR